MSITIQDILRAGHTKRWNIVNTTREQTVAEHLFNVAMIARTIHERLHLADYRDLVLDWALLHDIPEVVCGDPPSPTKGRMRDMGFDIENLYDAIDPTYKEVKETAKTTGVIYDIVKIADLMDAYHFLKENGVGRHAKQVASGIYDELTRKMDTFGTEWYGMLRFDSNLITRKLWTVFNSVMEGPIYE